MLFFELFPALFALVAFIIGIALFAMHHRARNDPADPPPAQKRPTVPGEREVTGRGRPSMR